MKSSVRKLAYGGMAVALSTILSFIVVWKLPNGGAITAVSMLPIIIYSIIANSKWGLLAGIAYAILQMIFGFYPPPTKNIESFFLEIFFDYIFAFGVLGLAGFFTRILTNLVKNFKFAAVCSAAIVIALRFCSHVVSGVTVWGSYAPKNESVWLYSFLYNGSYMLGELVLSIIVFAILVKAIKLDKFKLA